MKKKQPLSNIVPEALTRFELYLQGRGYHPGSIRRFCRHTGLFLSWLQQQCLEVSQVSCQEVLDYIDNIREEGLTIEQVNRHAKSISHYFTHLQTRGEVKINPAAGIQLKGIVYRLPHDLLSPEELQRLYEDYLIQDERSHQHKALLSLLIYQGLAPEDLHHLRVSDVKLREGKLYLSGAGRNAGRILKLEAEQIIDLQEYIGQIRPKLLQKAGIPPETISRLFFSARGYINLRDSLWQLTRALSKQQPKLRNMTQIRQSVITEWLKEKDIRLVQYLAGHRSVKATERYQTNKLEDLKEALNRHHPLK